jgi:hypothetical protein
MPLLTDIYFSIIRSLSWEMLEILARWHRRFLDKPHFLDGPELMRPIVLRDRPTAFRRLLFINAKPLRWAWFPR